jgi:hypothetical protein
LVIEIQPTAARMHEAAVRIAWRCRHLIQAVLREEVGADADREFYRVACLALEMLQ